MGSTNEHHARAPRLLLLLVCVAVLGAGCVVQTVKTVVVTRPVEQTAALETTVAVAHAVQVVATSTPAALATLTLTPSSAPTGVPTPTPTPIPWETYLITETIRIGNGNIGKLWMPVPRDWDGVGMTNVNVVRIAPEPHDLYQDEHGNVIAFWNAGYRDAIDYQIVFRVDLAPAAYAVVDGDVGAYDTASEEYLRYTQPSKWIQSDAEEIAQLADNIVGGEENPYRQARLV